VRDKVCGDPDFPLWVWREKIDQLIDTYGEDAFMYINSGYNSSQLVVTDEAPGIATQGGVGIPHLRDKLPE
jgi:hypothetical protein